MLTFFSIAGIVLTSYAIYVEKVASKKNSEKKTDQISVNFGKAKFDISDNEEPKKVACDINDKISCSSVLSSEYAYLVGKYFKLPKNSIWNVPNTYYGMLYYFAVFIYPFIWFPFKAYLLVGVSFMTLVVSAILAYIMQFLLKQYCVVCVLIYVVNISIFCIAINQI